jgi:hypothetical protein
MVNPGTRVVGGVQTGAIRATVTQQDRTVLDQTQQILGTSSQTDLNLQTTHRFSINGQDAVNYRDVNSRAAADRGFSMGMEPGATYNINASGTINKGNGNNTPSSPQAQDQSKTRLQMQVRGPDGNVVNSFNYSPGMTIRADDYPPGSTLHGVVADGTNAAGIRDNSGRFNVSVTQSEVRSTTVNNTIVGGDRVAPGTTPTTPTTGTPPPAGSVQPPDVSLSGPPADRALRQDGTKITTSSGYDFIPAGNSGLLVQAPKGADGKSNNLYFDFNGGTIRESDGTQLLFNEGMKNGTYNLPDGSQLRFRTGEGGRVTGYDIASYDAHANVTLQPPGAGGIPQNPNVQLTNDGREWRVKNAENLNQPNFHLVGYGADAAQGGEALQRQQIGLYYSDNRGVTGWLDGVHTGPNGEQGNLIQPGSPAVVNRDLQPKIGTPAYQHAIENELFNNWGATSGYFQQAGMNPTQARESAWQYVQPQQQQAAQASAWSQMVGQDPNLQNWFGGMPGHFDSMPQGMNSMMLMYSLLSWQQSMAIPPMNTYWG